MPIEIHSCMKNFRLASRELFNHYFKVPNQAADCTYEFYEGFNAVEQALLQALVLDPCAVPKAKNNYSLGFDAHPGIRVRLPFPNVDENLVSCSDKEQWAPIVLNREINSGYWDYPIDKFTNEVTLLFVGYFDWDRLHSRDNAYVRVQVSDWPGHPEVVGKQGLIESHYVRYSLITDAMIDS